MADHDPATAATRRIWARCCTRIAWISGAFSLALACLLLVNSIRLYHGPGNGKYRLVEAEELAPLKQQLRNDPKNGDLKQQIRTLDQQLREKFFLYQKTNNRAGWGLLAGAAVFLASLKLANRFRQPAVPAPSLPTRRENPGSRHILAARAVAGTTLCIAGLATSFFWHATPRWSGNMAGTATHPAPHPAGNTDSFPSDAEIAKNWPRFRGPDGSGISNFPNTPESWDAESGTHVLWKTKLTLPGENSPILWNGTVFLTGADANRREVQAYDANTGTLRWKQSVTTPQGSRAEPPEVLEDTGFAAPTATTDGMRVFAIFANGDLTGITVDGQALWTVHLGTPHNIYGHSTSLLLWRNRLIVQFDQGEADEMKSKIMALDTQTGETVWSASRPVPHSWATPILIRHNNREQIITTADPWVTAYDPSTGKELWKANCMKGDIAVSPVFANGMIYVASDQSAVVAIRADGSGDVTDTHIAWKNDEKTLPDTCSMFCDGPRVYTLAAGSLAAFDSLTGRHLWSHDTDTQFKASPSLANGRIFLLDTEGTMIIGEASAAGFKETGRAKIGEPAGASPAFAPGRIYLRGKHHLICITNKDG